MSQLTDNSTTDAAFGEAMLKKCGEGVGGEPDGAYDKSAICKLLPTKGISGPPEKWVVTCFN